LIEKQLSESREYMNRVKVISRCALSILMIVAGTMHFVDPEFFLKIMPPYLPLHKELVLISGAAELLLGVLLLVPQTSQIAAWGIVALLIAVFPANVYLYQNPDILPAPAIMHLLRLPFQGVFILWAYWFTRPTMSDS
jgi:uncharacterized membrane protein